MTSNLSSRQGAECDTDGQPRAGESYEMVIMRIEGRELQITEAVARAQIANCYRDIELEGAMSFCRRLSVT